MPLKPGHMLAHYRLVEKIGEGGMGVVWKATDIRLGRTVAIKVLSDRLSDDSRLRERFEREARTISSLNHAHICTLHDVGRHEGIDFIVMEHLEGEALADRLREGALPLEEALRCGIEIAGALHEAHRAGVVHRDLKPGNIMLTRQGVKLLDFGLAKLVSPPAVAPAEDATTKTMDAGNPITDAGTVLGTVPYMAPEQLEGKEADLRTDMFALGSLLYEMITGRRAFAASSRAGLISAIMTSDPPSLSEHQPAAPPLLDHLLRKCLAKDPDARWHSALDLASELEWIAGAGTETAGASEQPRSRAPSGPQRSDYRIEYFRSSVGSSIAAARGGHGRPLFVVPAMVDSIETTWATYAEAFGDHEVILYDRRGTGLSERNSLTGEAEPYLQDAEAVVSGFRLEDFDVLGTLLGTVEAASLAARNADRVRRLVLRSPVIGMADWASIPVVKAALAAMEHDWDYFVESFSQLVVGWGNPRGRLLAERFRVITSRDELRAIFDAYRKLNLSTVLPEIRASTLVEHHPGYFFPNTYSQRIASLIGNCRMAVFSGADGEFMTDFSIAQTFLSAETP